MVKDDFRRNDAFTDQPLFTVNILQDEVKQLCTLHKPGFKGLPFCNVYGVGNDIQRPDLGKQWVIFQIVGCAVVAQNTLRQALEFIQRSARNEEK